MSLAPLDLNVENPHREYKVLCLDGGGIRGVAVARILEEIETRLNKPIHKLFDLVIGTSTGGILTLLMTVPTKPEKADKETKEKIISAKGAKEFYQKYGAKIFEQSLIQSTTIGQMFTTKHSDKGLKEVIRQLYTQDKTLKDAVIHAGIVATDKSYNKSIVMNSWRAKKYHHDYRHNVSVDVLARATSAAPTFFPTVKHEDYTKKEKEELTPGCVAKEEEYEKTLKAAHKRKYSTEWQSYEEPHFNREKIYLEDGGCTNNNPSWLGFKLIKKIALQEVGSLQHVTLKFVSVGTGSPTGDDEDPARYTEEDESNGWGIGKLRAGMRLAMDDAFFINKRTYRNHMKMSEEFQFMNQEENYKRIQFKVDKEQFTGMDDASEYNVNNLIHKAENYLFIRPNVLTPEFVDVLQLIDPTYGHTAEQVQNLTKEFVKNVSAFKMTSAVVSEALTATSISSDSL